MILPDESRCLPDKGRSEDLAHRDSQPDLRADSSSVAIESVELAHRGLSRPTLGNLLAGIGGAISGSLDVSFGL